MKRSRKIMPNTLFQLPENWEPLFSVCGKIWLREYRSGCSSLLLVYLTAGRRYRRLKRIIDSDEVIAAIKGDSYMFIKKVY